MELTMPSAVYSSVAAADVNAPVSVVVPVQSPAIAVAMTVAEVDLNAVNDVVSG